MPFWPQSIDRIPMKVYLNGHIIDADQATVSVQDAGFTHAVGLFETMQAFHGKVFRLDAHLSRLAASAVEVGLVRKLDTAPLRAAVHDTLAANDMAFARIRLTVTAGSISLLGPAPDTPPEPTVLVSAAPPTQYDPAFFTKGVLALIAPANANPFDAAAGHKTLAYWQRLRTLRIASAAGAGEAIWLSVTNHLAGGAVSNLFLVKDGVLMTPIAHGEEEPGALPAPVLPGITRAAILELAREHDIPVKTQMLTVEELLDADEVFLTNSSWLVLPVRQVEQKAIGGGQVGDVTNTLRGALGDLIEGECKHDDGE